MYIIYYMLYMVCIPSYIILPSLTLVLRFTISFVLSEVGHNLQVKL